MFELKYKITQSDVKAVNKSIMWAYFIPYLVAALVGIAVGITAVVLRPRPEMLVMGIILIILGAILLACAIMLLIAPKNFVASALLPSDDIERLVKLTDDNITVSTDGKEDIVIDYFEINKLKLKNNTIIAYIGKEQVLIIKDAFTSSGSLQVLFEFMKGRMTTIAPTAQNNTVADKEDAHSGKIENTEAPEAVGNAQNEELVDALAGEADGAESQNKVE